MRAGKSGGETFQIQRIFCLWIWSISLSRCLFVPSVTPPSPTFPPVDIPHMTQHSPRGTESSSQLFFVPKCVHVCACALWTETASHGFPALASLKCPERKWKKDLWWITFLWLTSFSHLNQKVLWFYFQTWNKFVKDVTGLICQSKKMCDWWKKVCIEHVQSKRAVLSTARGDETLIIPGMSPGHNLQ